MRGLLMSLTVIRGAIGFVLQVGMSKKTYNPQEAIIIKRDGRELSKKAIEHYVQGVVDGVVSDAQIAAFAMAVCLRGMTVQERTDFTLAMAKNSEHQDWLRLNLDGPLLDKHSTGGVGDKVSFIVAAVLAACGCFVPMISGRTLGHTGGTLDKLESLPGYDVHTDAVQVEKVLAQTGLVIIGASEQLVPADRRIYDVRDRTATVKSLDLITCSILSKKLAEDLDGLVLDVKYGSGAFFSDSHEAMALAQSMVQVANHAGLQTHAILSDMNSVLGHTAGNWLELVEALDVMTAGVGEPRLTKVCEALVSEALQLSELAHSPGVAEQMFTDALQSGRAAECFAQMVAGLGGPKDLLKTYKKNKTMNAPVVRDILAPADGYISAIDVTKLGWALSRIGCGRANPEGRIDHRVGLTHAQPCGTKVTVGQTILARIHAASESDANYVAQAFDQNVKISPDPPKGLPLVQVCRF
ncbi:MAG: thymidine phosphorylase [Pseudomonadota bacterium]